VRFAGIAFSSIGCVVVARAGIALGAFSALAALVLYLLVPTAFIVAIVSVRGRQESPALDA